MSRFIILFLCVLAICESLHGVQASEDSIRPFGNNLIGDTCNIHDDCVGSWPEVECGPQKICVCTPGHIQKNDLSNCLRIIDEIGYQCQEPQQCQAGILGQLSDCAQNPSIPTELICKCIDSAVSEGRRSKCLPKANLVEDACEIQPQCIANLGPSNCINNRCTCLSTAVPSANRSRCLTKKFIGQACTEQVECTHLSPAPVGCLPVDIANPDLGSICRCTDGFVNVGHDKCVRLATVIGEKCDEHEIQCRDLMGAFCENGRICSCNSTSAVISQDRKRCLHKREELNEECEQNNQCQKENSECADELCKCKEGEYVELSGDCVTIVNEIDMPCHDDIQCKSGILGPLSECVISSSPGIGLKTCQCSKDTMTFPEAPIKQCYTIINEVGDPCEVDAQCQHTLTNLSNCDAVENECICIPGAVPSSSFDKCIQGPLKVGDACHDDNQCPGVATGGGQCFPNKCICRNGYIPSQELDDCLPIVNELGKECTEPQQCQKGFPDEWSDCVEMQDGSKQCQCSSLGVVDSNKPNYCYKKAEIIGESCLVPIQCAAGLGQSICDNSICRCTEDAVPSPDNRLCALRAYLGDPCNFLYECSHIPYNASCQLINPSRPEDGRICKCNVGYIDIPGNFNACYKVAELIGESCEYHPRQCTYIDNTICDDRKCQCDYTDYVPSQDSKRCLEKVRDLNRPCEESPQCQVTHSLCRGGNCVCGNGYVESIDDLGKCLPITPGIDQPCEENIQCTAGPLGDGSECRGNTCKCRQSFGYYDSKCYAQSSLNDRCNEDANCIVGINEYAFCNRSDHWCSCKDIAIPYRDSCYRKATQLGESCMIDQQCTANLGNYTECGDHNTCTCVQGAVPDVGNRRCLPGNVRIGDQCQYPEQCIGHPDRSECSRGVCNCVDGFISSENRLQCLPIQNQIDGPCQENQQCSNGAPGNYSYCPDGSCRCRPEAVLPPEENHCLRKATFVGDSCEISLQCTENLGLSYCFDRARCRCLDTATENHDNTKCLLKRYLNDECTEVEECSHIPDSASCIPVNPSDPSGRRVCKCNSGYANPTGMNNACYRLANLIGETCNRDPVQCSSILNSRCNNGNKLCECADGYVPSADRKRCVATEDNINAPCEVNEQCKVENSQCLPLSSGGQRVCQCKQGYVESQIRQNQCLEIVEDINQPCSEDIQCTSGLSKNSKCSNSRCQCITGYEFYVDECYRPRKLGDRCEFDGECKVGVNNFTFCDQRNNSCACSGNAIRHDNTCYQILRVGDKCNSNIECSLNIKGDVFCDDVCFCLLTKPDLFGHTCSAMGNRGNLGILLMIFFMYRIF